MLTAVPSSTMTELLLDHLFLPKGSKCLKLGITVSLGEHKLKTWRLRPQEIDRSVTGTSRLMVALPILLGA